MNGTLRPSLGLLLSLSLATAAWSGEAAHLGGEELKPIAETLAGLDLAGFAALPVQHSGRYKPFHSLGMEICDAIAYTTVIAKGHTPVTSLLDLAFCFDAYRQQPIARVKHTEMRRDLALAIPEAERPLLQSDGRLTPARITDRAFIDQLEILGRNTTKTKAVNQVRGALEQLDVGALVFQMRLLAVPDGAHSDRWRNPSETAGSFAGALAGFVRSARAAGADNLARFASRTWALLPLTPATAMTLRFERDDLVAVNQQALKPLWLAAGAGKVGDEAIAGLASDPAAWVGRCGIDAAAAPAVVSGLARLAAAWPLLGVSSEQVGDPALRAALAPVLEQVAAAWDDLGEAWSAARHGQLATAALQKRFDAFVAAAAALRELHARDRAARGEPALALKTDLELTYWKLNGFTHWVFAFLLLAVPFLALGAIGGMRVPLWLGYGLGAFGLVGQITAFLIRGVLAERIPLANLYESMAAASLLCSLVAVVGEVVLGLRARRAARAGRAQTTVRGALALGAALFGCLIVFAQVLLEAHDINAFISPQMPILSEFWLRVHTACIVSSYGLIALGGLMSLTYLLMRIWLPWDDLRCEAWDRTTFAIDAVAMLVLWVGLTLGAVWAAVSWGRPWGWDPKEVFALLTWVVYIGLVHLRIAVAPRNRALATSWVALAAFAVMIFNWYWVNVRLAGLHSYA
jgi:ABC-type transport system involved in cytochrome c biogenesis permease subunit